MDTAELYKVLSDKIDTNHETTILLLTSIQQQTTRTNGRVTAHDLQLKELNDENSEIRMIKKYPKLAMLILVVSVCVFLAGGWIGYQRLRSEQETIMQRQQIILNSEQSPLKK